jgi:CBS domain-containing protein
MKVKDIMHGITMVDRNTSVFDAAKLMSKKDIGSILTKEGECIKIVTERDILKKVVALGNDPKNTKISEIMSECAFTIDSDKDVFFASDLLNKHRIRRLPVVERGKLVGILTARDIAKSLTYMSAGRVREYGRRSFGREER